MERLHSSTTSTTSATHPSPRREQVATRQASTSNPVRHACLAGVQYVLGEHRHDWTALPDLDASLKSVGMARDPELWGWGSYHRTDRMPVELAIDVARQTLTETGVQASDIDAVLMCSVLLPNGVSAHRSLTHRFLAALDMETTPLLGITLGRCATLVCGIRLADDLIASGRYRTILVVSTDAVSCEHQRFEPFAIFSDAAASCIVTSARLPGGYQVISTVQASQAVAGATDGPDAGGKLAARANRQLQRVQLEAGSFHKIFHDNLFIPIVSLREQLAGFHLRQLYLDNIASNGHAFGCDPLINLATYTAQNRPPEGALLGLFSGTPGVRSGIVLQAAG